MAFSAIPALGQAAAPARAGTTFTIGVAEAAGRTAPAMRDPYPTEAAGWGPAAGQMRSYPGTADITGRKTGSLVRVAGRWSLAESLSLSCDYEHFAASGVLKRAGLSSGSYGYVGATFRYGRRAP